MLSFQEESTKIIGIGCVFDLDRNRGFGMVAPGFLSYYCHKSLSEAKDLFLKYSQHYEESESKSQDELLNTCVCRLQSTCRHEHKITIVKTY